MTYYLSKDEELRRLRLKLKGEILVFEANKVKCSNYKKVISDGIHHVKIYKDKLAENMMNVTQMQNRIKE